MRKEKGISNVSNVPQELLLKRQVQEDADLVRQVNTKPILVVLLVLPVQQVLIAVKVLIPVSPVIKDIKV